VLQRLQFIEPMTLPEALVLDLIEPIINGKREDLAECAGRPD